MDKKEKELRSCVPIYTQHATKESNNATSNATNNATLDLKALALQGLKRNQRE